MWFAALWYVVQPAVAAAVGLELGVGVADGIDEGRAVADAVAVAVAEGEGNRGAAPHPARATRVIAADAGARREASIPVSP